MTNTQQQTPTMIDLTPFLATDADPREYLRKPMRLDDYVYATNGSILVRVPADDTSGYPAAPEPMRPQLPSVLGALVNPALTWVNATSIELHPQIPCTVCNGQGHVHEVVCDDCDGEGVFAHGFHEYTCQNCGGRGCLSAIAHSNDNKRTCSNCHGSGAAPTFKQVGRAWVQTHHLRMLQALPGCRITLGEDERNTLVFTFDGGVGAVMPVRQ